MATLIPVLAALLALAGCAQGHITFTPNAGSHARWLLCPLRRPA